LRDHGLRARFISVGGDTLSGYGDDLCRYNGVRRNCHPLSSYAVREAVENGVCCFGEHAVTPYWLGSMMVSSKV